MENKENKARYEKLIVGHCSLYWFFPPIMEAEIPYPYSQEPPLFSILNHMNPVNVVNPIFVKSILTF